MKSCLYVIQILSEKLTLNQSQLSIDKSDPILRGRPRVLVHDSVECPNVTIYLCNRLTLDEVNWMSTGNEMATRQLKMSIVDLKQNQSRY